MTLLTSGRPLHLDSHTSHWEAFKYDAGASSQDTPTWAWACVQAYFKGSPGTLYGLPRWCLWYRIHLPMQEI